MEAVGFGISGAFDCRDFSAQAGDFHLVESFQDDQIGVFHGSSWYWEALSIGGRGTEAGGWAAGRWSPELGSAAAPPAAPAAVFAADCGAGAVWRELP